MHSSINVIAAAGLALGGALGLAGAMVTQQNVQAILWAIDGAGLVMATPLLAIKYFRRGNDVVAGGFLVFAIGESVIMLSGPAAGLAGSVSAFATGTALWGTALLLVSILFCERHISRNEVRAVLRNNDTRPGLVHALLLSIQRMSPTGEPPRFAFNGQ